MEKEAGLLSQGMRSETSKAPQDHEPGLEIRQFLILCLRFLTAVKNSHGEKSCGENPSKD
jgi:hypothetical protein